MNFKICILIVLVSIVYSCRESRKSYEINAKIPGMYDGLVVELRNAEDGYNTLITSDTVKNESFRLSGTVKEPIAVNLVITNKNLIPENASYELKHETSSSMWLENVKMQYKAKHFDSIPLSYVYMSSPLYRESNVTIEGGEGQRRFADFRNKLRPYEIDRSEKSLSYYNCNDNKVKDKRYKDLYNAHKNLLSAYKSFIIQDRSSIALFIAEKFLDVEYSFSKKDLLEWNDIARSIKGDTARVNRFVNKLDKMVMYTTGTKYTDVEALDIEGERSCLSDYLKGDKFIFIDVWASWCLPCKAAIPLIKELYADYSDKVQFLSISVDKKEKDWCEALNEEQMQWPQLLRGKTTLQQLEKGYYLSGVPRFILIDKTGIIRYVGNNPKELKIIFEENI